jgi:hypothetical protein
MIRAVLAARRHETSLAFERIRMRAGALFAVGHGHAEVPTRRTRRRTLGQPARDQHLLPRRRTAGDPIRFALARAVKALILLATA